MFVKAVLSLAKRKIDRTILPCMGIIICADDSFRCAFESVSAGPVHKHKRTDPDHHRCIRNFMGTVVYKHPGIPSEKTESGNGHADITFKQRL